MSGLYIPNVCLPGDGDFELWIAVRKDGSFTYNISGEWRDGNQKATPVPDHGRLGDLDELYATLKKWLIQNRHSMTEATKVCIRGVLEGIAAAPTIISDRVEI